MFGVDDRMSSGGFGSDRNSLRHRNSIAEDDYFPSLLTAAPSSSSNTDKSKQNNSLGQNKSAGNGNSYDYDYPQKSRLRISFAENLKMKQRNEDFDMDFESSPFHYGENSDNSYMDRVYQRKSKSDTQQKKKFGSTIDEDDIPLPPTASLSNTSTLFHEPLPGSHLNQTSYSKSEYSGPSSREFFPSLQDDEWGRDRQYWITVYGFPTSAKSYVLHHFQTLGEVISYSGGIGNWLHMRFHTRLQAEKALSQDGKKLPGNIMIGVKKCFPSEVENPEELDTSYLKSSNKSAGSPDLEVEPSDSDIMLPPRRRQDICSRIFNYLFKW